MTVLVCNRGKGEMIINEHEEGCKKINISIPIKGMETVV
jgi:hypothetical protein